MKVVARRAWLLPILLITASCSQVNSNSKAGTSEIAVILQPRDVTIAPGASVPLASLVTGSSDIQVAWSVAEGTSGGSVTITGLYTAPSSVGTYHVIATSHADPSKSALAEITVAANQLTTQSDSGGASGGSGGVSTVAGDRSGTGGSDATGGTHDASGTGGLATTGGVTSAGGTSGKGGLATTGGVTSAGGTSGKGGLATTGGVTGAGGIVSSGGEPASTASIQLIGNEIYDSAGKVIVARGPEDVMAGADQTGDIDTITGLGANAMRMLLTLDAANGMTPAGFDTLLAKAVAKHMLVWVSLFTWDSSQNHLISSALGGGNFYSLTSPVGDTCSSNTPSSCYLAVWSRQWLKDLMSKYRSNVIIDAGQEFISTGDASTEAVRVVWAGAAKTNIQFFRSQGYTNPLEIMANYSGRDLYCIAEYGDAIRAVDTVQVNGNPQTMFGWQAYWGTSDGYYNAWQGSLFLGKNGVLTGAQAIHQFAATQSFPIEIGVDNYASDTAGDYQAEIDQAAADGMSWLWWSWKNGSVECPLSGATCQAYVTGSSNGFKGAKPLTN